jgi:hypothetical protein
LRGAPGSAKTVKPKPCAASAVAAGPKRQPHIQKKAMYSLAAYMFLQLCE